MHPELENKTKEELEQILDKGKNKNDKALASQRISRMENYMPSGTGTRRKFFNSK